MSAIPAPAKLLDFLREENHTIDPVDHRFEVFVDGARQRLAFQYSVDGRFADVYVEDETTGGILTDGLGRKKTTRVRGQISIRSNND